MTPAELRARTETLAVRILQLTAPCLERLPTRDIALQLRRSATSTAQNYGACCVGRSRADFLSKLKIALEEADESARWLRMLVNGGLASGKEFDALLQEATELASILGASVVTASRRK
jgi:four helix bundle protein